MAGSPGLTWPGSGLRAAPAPQRQSEWCGGPWGQPGVDTDIVWRIQIEGQNLGAPCIWTRCRQGVWEHERGVSGRLRGAGSPLDSPLHLPLSLPKAFVYMLGNSWGMVQPHLYKA